MGTWFLLYRQQDQACGVDAFRYCYLGLPLKTGLGRAGIALLWGSGLVAIAAAVLTARGRGPGIEDVLADAVDAAAAIPRVDASLVLMGVDTAEVLVASAGLSSAELREENEVGDWLETGKARLVQSVAVDQSGPTGANAAPIRDRLAVPLETLRAGRGRLVVLTRSPNCSFAGEDLRRLEEAAEQTCLRLESVRVSDDVPF